MTKRAMTLSELIAKRDHLWAQYKTFSKEDFYGPDWEPGKTPVRSQALQELDQKIKELNQQIWDHPDWRDLERDIPEKVIAKLKTDDDFAERVYASFCNVTWRHDQGAEYSCSWRYAGGLVASLRNKGEDYLDFYCADDQREGSVDPDFEDMMAEVGWRPEAEDMND